MLKTIVLALVCLSSLLVHPASAAQAGAKIYFVSPKNLSTVKADAKGMIKVQFGVKGMEVKPAGQTEQNTGHHHLIVDGAPIPEGQVVPADATHLHFGKGQTETELHLTPGKHTLTLQFANGAHVSYGETMSSTISITVN